MKTLIVQGLSENNILPNELKLFWKPCMATVKQWAELNGWDYKYFSDKRNDEFDVTSWNLRYNRENEISLTKNQFRKFQWMDGWTDYDWVFWIDSDCYIYGNPEPFSFKIAPTPFLWFLNNEVVLGRWHRPNMSIWGGPQKLVQDAIDWARYQFEHPDDQHEIVQTLRCLNRYSSYHKMRFENDLRANWSVHNFTEEIFMIGYTNSRINKSVVLIQEGSEFSGIGKAPASWIPDSIIHFGGSHKQRDLSRFRAYKAYMAYLGNLAPTKKDFDSAPSYQNLIEWRNKIDS